MLSEKLLDECINLISQHLSSLIIQTIRDFDNGRLKFIIKGGRTLHILFNNYGEYSYNLILSTKKHDRVRFDDRNWDVKTKPHHCHPRFSRDAIESPMSGDPKLDMEKLIDMILNSNYPSK